MKLFSWLNEIQQATQQSGESSEEPSEPPLSPILKARLQELENMSVRDVMVPRSLIIALDADVQLQRVKRLKTSKTAYFPVYKGDLDHIQGWVAKAKILELMDLPRTIDVSIADYVQPVGKIDEDVSVADLADAFLKSASPFLVVKNSLGNTVGIVHLADFVELMFGFELESPVSANSPEFSVARNYEV